MLKFNNTIYIENNYTIFIELNKTKTSTFNMQKNVYAINVYS